MVSAANPSASTSASAVVTMRSTVIGSLRTGGASKAVSIAAIWAAHSSRDELLRFMRPPYQLTRTVFVRRTVFVLTQTSPRSLREAWIALAGLSAVFLFEMLDNSILNVALPTIGRDLNASTTALQWVSNSYAVVFGGLMLVFGAVADRFGRRRVMLVGLVLLGLASLATLFVTSVTELIAVRSLMGVAAAMTTPGSIALAFRLFTEDDLRVRAMTFISTVGL